MGAAWRWKNSNMEQRMQMIDEAWAINRIRNGGFLNQNSLLRTYFITAFLASEPQIALQHHPIETRMLPERMLRVMEELF